MDNDFYQPEDSNAGDVLEDLSAASPYQGPGLYRFAGYPDDPEDDFPDLQQISLRPRKDVSFDEQDMLLVLSITGERCALMSGVDTEASNHLSGSEEVAYMEELISELRILRQKCARTPDGMSITSGLLIDEMYRVWKLMNSPTNDDRIE